MPRRASSGISRGQIAGLSLVVLGVCVVAFLLLRILGGDLTGGTGGRSTATELNITDYLENANSLRGNVYQVTGTIEEQLRWTPENGRLFSVEASHDGKITPLPIRVPQEFSSQNIDRGATFRFIIEVGKNGLLIAQNVEKT